MQDKRGWYWARNKENEKKGKVIKGVRDVIARMYRDYLESPYLWYPILLLKHTLILDF